MKKIITILTLTLLFIIPTKANDSRKAVENGFAKGSAEIVYESMADRVFMVVYPLRKPLPKDEAKNELANFFLQNKPKSFSVLHDSSQDNVIYMICKYATAKGDYRIHILIDVAGEAEKITQIRVETL